MSKDNNYKALNIRVKDHHDQKEYQTQMIGLFKHNAYEKGLTQAEYFAYIISEAYVKGIIGPMKSKEPVDDGFDELYQDLRVGKYE